MPNHFCICRCKLLQARLACCTELVGARGIQRVRERCFNWYVRYVVGNGGGGAAGCRSAAATAVVTPALLVNVSRNVLRQRRLGGRPGDGAHKQTDRRIEKLGHAEPREVVPQRVHCELNVGCCRILFNAVRLAAVGRQRPRLIVAWVVAAVPPAGVRVSSLQVGTKMPSPPFKAVRCAAGSGKFQVPGYPQSPLRVPALPVHRPEMLPWGPPDHCQLLLEGPHVLAVSQPVLFPVPSRGIFLRIGCEELVVKVRSARLGNVNKNEPLRCQSLLLLPTGSSVRCCKRASRGLWIQQRSFVSVSGEKGRTKMAPRERKKQRKQSALPRVVDGHPATLTQDSQVAPEEKEGCQQISLHSNTASGAQPQSGSDRPNVLVRTTRTSSA